MTESLRMALAPRGVGAAVLCPGLCVQLYKGPV